MFLRNSPSRVPAKLASMLQYLSTARTWLGLGLGSELGLGLGLGSELGSGLGLGFGYRTHRVADLARRQVADAWLGSGLGPGLGSGSELGLELGLRLGWQADACAQEVVLDRPLEQSVLEAHHGHLVGVRVRLRARVSPPAEARAAAEAGAQAQAEAK